jgi:pantoate--beta-alanine ligase
MSLIQTINTINQINKIKNDWHKKGLKIGLVPTMGALHQGHMSLVKEAKKICDKVIVSVFVNPTQFAPNEDFDKYPRTLEKDVSLCSQNGVDIVFAPSANEMYPEKISTEVIPPDYIKNCLCGISRPTHFNGVALVVLKLLNISSADFAFFGEKDFQQLSIIKKMVKDLNVNCEIIGCPIIREKDGLAVSSRNIYLSEKERIIAPKIYLALQKASTMSGIKSLEIKNTVEDYLKEDFELEYFKICDSLNLQEKEIAKTGNRALIAVKLGQTRLIDNIEVK